MKNNTHSKIKNKKLPAVILLLLQLFFWGEMKGQDFLLSQPYNNPLVVSPSFAGMANGARAAISYRNQWPGMNQYKTYSTIAGSFDYFIQDYNSSIGLCIVRDDQGGGLFKSLDAALQYNHLIQLGEELFFRPGVELKLVNRSLDYSKFIFSENIYYDGSILNNETPFPVEYDSYTKLDAAASVLFYNKYFWAGFGMDHLIPYDASFLREGGRVPLRYTLSAGYNWHYEETRHWNNDTEGTVTFATLFQHQAQFNQMDIGATWTRDFFQLGAWYRGFFVPVKSITSYDAVVVILGLSLDQFKIAYSYDISISSLVSVSSGTHEISLSFVFSQKERSPISFFCK